MIQSIYAEVSNGNQVRCGKRIPKYQEVPIPLMKSNYLGEFRTQLEKAKARKNLGIGDEYTLTWGNITGHIEDNTALVNFIEQQWKYEYVSPYIQQQIKNVKEALDYALYYVSTYEANDQQVQELINEYNNLVQQLEGLQQQISGITSNDITSLQRQINEINQILSNINENLININVDKNIKEWVDDNLEHSSSLYFKDVLKPQFDDEGNLVTDNEGNPVMVVDFQVMEVRISKQDGNIIEVKEDGLYVKNYDLSVQNIIEDVQELQQQMGTVTEDVKNLKYTTELPDSTTSPTHQGITVEDIKNKTMSEILDKVLFPAEVRELVEPTIEYSDIETLVEVNTPVIFPEVEYLAGDAGETIAQTNTVTYRGLNYEGDYYNQVGTYIFTAIVQYDDGEYLKNNRGETTNKRIEGGAVSTTKSVKVTYPWFAGNVEDGVQKQVLVPTGEQSGFLDFSLTKHAVVKIPGNRSIVNSFRVDSGLGYLDVDMDGWEETAETINNVPYKVFTKVDNYAAILPHKINFTINV